MRNVKVPQGLSEMCPSISRSIMMKIQRTSTSHWRENNQSRRKRRKRLVSAEESISNQDDDNSNRKSNLPMNSK